MLILSKGKPKTINLLLDRENKDATNGANVLITFNNLVSGTNTNATVTIPTNVANSIKTYEPQCFSTTSTDDPTWLSGTVLLRPC